MQGLACSTYSTQASLETGSHPQPQPRPKLSGSDVDTARLQSSPECLGVGRDVAETTGRGRTIRRPKHKLCVQPGCLTAASFNVKGMSERLYCGDHKQHGMTNVSKILLTCEEEGCTTRHSYNTAGETKARFCAAHKLAGMVNVLCQQCEEPSCNKQPSFNVIGESRRRFCVTHKSEEMIDVVNKVCEVEGCFTQPSYGMANGQRLRCATHKRDGMVRFTRSKARSQK